MAVTVKVNGTDNTLVHKGSMGMAKCTAPDVCKTPSPGGPVPIPYPVIISMSSDLADGTTTVTADGGNSCAIKGSNFSRCSGDEPGTAGGVKSSTNMKESTWILYSFDVKMDGANACRESDKMMMNHENTICAAGESQFTLKVLEMENRLCDIFCDATNEQWWQGATKHSWQLEGILRDSGALSMFGNVLFANPFPLPGFSTATTAPDVALCTKQGKVQQCFDFKTCNDSWKGDEWERQTALAYGAEPIEISCKECGCCQCP